MLSGRIGTGSGIVPPGNVRITVNGITVIAPIAANGSFSTSLATSTFATGTYAIVYRYDASQNFAAATGSGTLTVLNVKDAISAIIGNAVNQLVASGLLQPAQATALNTLLNAAVRALDLRNAPLAITALQAFSSGVRTLVRNGVLSPADGAVLITAADNIIVLLR
jgi:hypothetical protein